jgi:hypothetical protein
MSDMNSGIPEYSVQHFLRDWTDLLLYNFLRISRSTAEISEELLNTDLKMPVLERIYHIVFVRKILSNENELFQRTK